MTGVTSKTRCRALIAGFGRPGMRDLDFGRQLTRYLENLSWPEGVVVEDLSYAAPLVLHRLQELQPAKLLLVGAAARGLGPPGALRRYAINLIPPGPEEVHRCLEESAQGVVDLDHTLAVARHWGGLPADTVVIEVEPADCSFGIGFSEELAASFDPILAMVRRELDCTEDGTGCLDFDAEIASADESASDESGSPTPAVEPSEGLMRLVRYAEEHERVRLLQPHRGLPVHDRGPNPEGVLLAGRSRPWGVCLPSGGAWFDVIPLEEGWLGVVMGDVAGRGMEAAGQMEDLRAAVRAYAILEGKSPGGLLAHADRLVHATGLGHTATLLYMALQPVTGELRISNAGHCPPLLLSAGMNDSHFVREARSEALGAAVGTARPEAALLLPRTSTLILFTGGLVESDTKPIAEGLETLRRAAVGGPGPVEDLCDHLLTVCSQDHRRDDDICLLVLRLAPPSDHATRRKCA